MRIEVDEEAVMRAMEEAGVRLEVIQGLPVWEFFPSPLHTIESERIHRSPTFAGMGGSHIRRRRRSPWSAAAW